MASKKKLTLGGSVFYTSMAIVMGVLVALAGALAFFMVLQGADAQITQQARDDRLALFRQWVVTEMTNVQTGAQTVAATLQPLSSDKWRSAVAALPERIPDLRRVVPFARGQVARDEHADLPIGFAASEMLKQVEAGEAVAPAAFKAANKRWYLQYAVAISDAQGQLAGTLLVIYEPEHLRKALASLPAGKYELYQLVDKVDTLVFESGEGSGDTVSAEVPGLGWKVAYTLPVSSLLNSAYGTYWLLILISALLIAGAGFGMMFLFGKKVAQDISSLAAFAGNLLGTGSSPAPRTQFPLTRHAMDVLQQLRNRRAPTEKTAPAKAAETAAPAETAPPVREEDMPSSPALPASAKGGDEPLFSGDDALDLYDADEDLLGLHDDKPASEKLDGGGGARSGMGIEEVDAVEVDPSIFRAYDIRGEAGKNLNPEVMTEIGRALGGEALQRGQKTLCLGRDGRHSSPELAQGLARGLMETGVTVIDLGVVPTPVLYFATHFLKTGSGAMVTGSHNPPEYNGVKIVLAGQTLADEGIQALLARINTRNYPSGAGKLETRSVEQDYIDTIVGDIAVAAPLKVVLDAGNGAAGEIAPTLIGELGCEVLPLNCEIDGRFPAHHPDPGKPENLQQLIEKVRETGADIGIAFDGDGDRLGVVTNTGKIIWPDRLLMLFAKDVVSRNPGADVLFDVKCSRRLNALISSYGGRPIMWRSGHSVMKAKMQETGALLAGELSGHIFFKERWFGFDDGIYCAARLLEILGVEEGTVDDVFADFPEDLSTPELAIPVRDDTKFLLMERLKASADWAGGSVSAIDGVRVEFADGWGLCRASNTTPTLTLRFEAESEDAMNRIQTLFKQQILAVDAALKLPF